MSKLNAAVIVASITILSGTFLINESANREFVKTVYSDIKNVTKTMAALSLRSRQ